MEVPTAQEIRARLIKVVNEDRKSLKNFYGQTEKELGEGLNGPIERGEKMARKLITDMGCSYEVAIDLTALVLYNVAVLVDDSGSMISEEGGVRKETLIQYIDSITEVCSLANDSGIAAMRFLNSKKGKRNWTTELSRGYLDDHEYGGVTRIGTELQGKVLDVLAPKVPNQRNPEQTKPLLVLIVTDGAVEGEPKGHLKRVIWDCVNERVEAGKGFEAVAFQFSRIGNDPGATQLLEELDNDPDLGEWIDILPVDHDLNRQLSEDKWFVLPKILLGSILPDWDGQDYTEVVLNKQRDHLGERREGENGGDVSDDDWAE